MSDRRIKERERVWGRRPVILRFDPGHLRPLEPKPADSSLPDQASAMLAALFQSVIQTDGVYSAPPSAPVEPKPQWFLVDSHEAQTVRTPIEVEQDEAEAEMEHDSIKTATAVAEPEAKPKSRSFWRLQGPHMSFHIFPPRQP
ncbi:MAG: hypothetical protein NT172_17010 [Planctomycetota bacterium]|nr:hypothetical protein [Planctomycetota bacterium]RLS25787.1 MAG: hypothetical protein DWH73_01450 [Planctomycetota bacterium]